MENFKNKIFAVIALLLMVSMVIPFAVLSTTSAHTPAWSIVSFAYCTVAPSPVGVGQTVQVYMWVDTPMPNSALTNNYRRANYQLTITKPDGTTESHTWAVISDPTGMQFFPYTPTETGNYTFFFSYPQQTFTWADPTWQNDTFQPANATATLQVTTTQLPSPLDTYPLPTEYWARPIEGENVYWYTISSNWLNAPYIRSGSTVTGGAGYGRYQPDGIAPNSAHVMWTKPIQFGGLVGGTDTSVLGETYYGGQSYNPRFSNAIVMQGYLYYQEPYGNSGGGGDYVAVDIRTGQELWRINCSATGVSLVPTFGYLYSFESGNQHGTLPNGLLIAPQTLGSGTSAVTAWRGYDPRTGVLTTMNVTYVPSGTVQAATLAASTSSAVSVPGPSGEYLIDALTNCGTATNPQYYLSQWNSSDVFGGAGGNGVGNWYSGQENANVPITPTKPTSTPPSGQAWNWNGTAWTLVASALATSTTPSYDWNISIPSLGGSLPWNVYRDAYYNDVMVLIQGSLGTGPRTLETGDNVTAVNLAAGSIGQILWTKSLPVAPDNETRQIIAVDNVARTIVTEDKETDVLTGFSLADGSQLWQTQSLIVEWDTVRRDTLTAYGNLYVAGYDGIAYCYNDKNGNLLWTYGNGGEGNSTYAGLETPYGHWPIFIDVIADGNVYIGSTEHSPNNPWYKNGEYRCINATTGAEIWTMTGWGTGMYVGQYDIVADGYFLYLNQYDDQIYSVGKGPSQTTVQAGPSVTTLGSSVLVQGFVTDISDGTKQSQQAARFPNGVPAVSDASQGTWMEYVYMQKPRPTNVTGVPVSISVVDANGNYRTIGNVTSDSNGFYSLNWKPDIAGKYTVYAAFTGSESYWPSNAETAFAVDQPTATTPATTVQPVDLQPTQMYIVGIGIALIIIVVAIGVVTIAAVRKKA
jgi:outer membrane protein assembly factor BamB